MLQLQPLTHLLLLHYVAVRPDLQQNMPSCGQRSIQGSDGCAGIAIGGDVFPGSTLSDHCLRYENIPQIKLIVVLGELGGQDEYSLVRTSAMAANCSLVDRHAPSRDLSAVPFQGKDATQCELTGEFADPWVEPA